MKNFETYKLNLKKSLEEKLFFMNQINLSSYDLILDYGCGTGDILMELANSNKLSNDCKLIGYDINPKMIEYAKTRLKNFTKKIIYVQDFENLKKEIEFKNKKTLIIFSTVLHEVSELEQIYLASALMPKFDTIVIRDMIEPKFNDKVKVKDRYRILKQLPNWQKKTFKKQWGKIKFKQDLYRLLLMNEFVDNFDTEVKEDYFSVLWDCISMFLKDYTKNIVDYTLSYRKKQVLKRFNYDMDDITHRNAIYNREKN